MLSQEIDLRCQVDAHGGLQKQNLDSDGRASHGHFLNESIMQSPFSDPTGNIALFMQRSCRRISGDPVAGPTDCWSCMEAHDDKHK